MTDDAAPPEPVAPPDAGVGDEMPRIRLTRRRVALIALFVASCVAFLYFALPKILGLRDTWNRIEHGNAWWLGLGAVLELLSFLGYVVLFRGVFVRGGSSRIGMRVSYEVTMAGLAATRLFASGGAGGLALTAWALRRSGMARRTVAQRMIAFTVLLYGVFLAALFLGGIGLYAGVLPGAAPFELTLVPALVAAVLVGLVLAVAFVPSDLDRLVTRWTGAGRLGWLAVRIAAFPAATSAGVRTAAALARARDPKLLGAVAWWGFDIAVLWACFHAFGGAPTIPVVVVCYCLGQLANLLPLPGGIGGVEGALIGSFSAFGVSGSLAVVAVLAYRAFAFWLPTAPGIVAYVQLRRTVRGWGAGDAVARARATDDPAYTL